MIRSVRTFLVEKTFFVSLEERKRAEEKISKPKALNSVITISRQHGCYGAETAIELQKLLGKGWVIFHREILEAIAQNSGVEQKFLEQFDEKTIPLIEEVVNGFTKPYLNDSTYLNHLRKLLLSVAERGKVIIIGRGANFILQDGFNVRLVGSKSLRLENLMEINKYTKKEAEEKLEEADKQRKTYIKKMFGQDVDDPLNYDLVINIKDLNFKETAKLIYEAAQISSIFK